ncbi:putative alanine and proline rich protein [Mycolicibacterium conceptionense]|uniref:Putative alanine and proline rich protein n=1 Tax=Mycolicibacterium conceptionense TaxID=451644 RepID=A0A0U1D1P1_9MYCO|nr:putative alanine and proline rich protein [Mycolicibacterium conceptionense]
MAQSADVAGRLDQGQSAVETFAEFVWACALLGYQNPDLTSYVGQVHDWYATEDGLDLPVLDADGAALTAVAGRAEQALGLQDAQLSALDLAWQGRGAQAAREFLYRHADAARQAVSAVRAAVDTLTLLHDQLWRAVDTKVAVTERIEARCAVQRQDWLAAARVVRTGLGNRDLASELIDAQVKPFVSNDIGADWVPAMRSARAAVSDAYAAAITALSDGPAPVFEIPGDLGPAWTPRVGAAVSAVGGGRTVPVGFVAPADSAPVPGDPTAGSAGATPPIGAGRPVRPEPDPTGRVGVSPSGDGLSGGGLSGMGSGVSGLGRQLADMLDGLIGSTDGALGSNADDALPGQLDPPETADAADELDDADDAGEEEDEEEPDLEPDDDDVEAEDLAAEEDNVADDDPAEAKAEEISAAAPGSVPPETTVEPAAEPVPVFAPGAPVPPDDATVVPADETPCAIAADELPQVGG